MTHEENRVLESLAKKISDIHVVLLGIEGTEENGLCGDIVDVKKEIVNISKRSSSNSLQVKGLWGATAIIITVILHVMGVY